MKNFKEKEYIRQNKFISERFKIMREFAKPTEGKIIVDLGASQHPVSRGLQSKKTIKVDGQKELNPDITCDLNKEIPIKNNFAEIVFAGEILEHLANPFLFLREVFRILKKNGILIITVPNITSLKNRLKVPFGFMPNFNAKKFPTKDDKWKWYHQSDWTIKWLELFLSKAGFKVKKITSNGIIFKNTIFVSGELCPPSLGDIIIIKAIKGRAQSK